MRGLPWLKASHFDRPLATCGARDTTAPGLRRKTRTTSSGLQVAPNADTPAVAERLDVSARNVSPFERLVRGEVQLTGRHLIKGHNPFFSVRAGAQSQSSIRSHSGQCGCR